MFNQYCIEGRNKVYMTIIIIIYSQYYKNYKDDSSRKQQQQKACYGTYDEHYYE